MSGPVAGQGSGRYAVVGHPVAHSRSPEIHARFAEETGEAMDYGRLDLAPEDFAEGLARFFHEDGAGANITLPHKLAAADLADRLTDEATAAGAVNTLRLESDRTLTGHNTDGTGLIRDLRENLGLDPDGARVLVLGASGAARAAVAALVGQGPSRLVVANRDMDKARWLSERLPPAEAVPYTDLDLAAFDLIVNATSASLAGELPPLPEGPFTGVAYDMVYAEAPTVFQHWAMDRGARLAADGWGMLVEQAAESFAFWRGVRPETDALLEPGRVLRR